MLKKKAETLKGNKRKTEEIGKEERGITLVALVITIIIIIILATVAIKFAFGENGLINRAEQASDFYANDTKYTEESMTNVESYLDGILAGTGGSEEDTPPEEEEPEFVDVLPTKPSLSDGMVPVKWDSTQSKWVRTDESDSEWYNYANKEWANVVLTPEEGANAGKDATGTVDVFNSDGTLNEDSAYTMLVWIPRYAYQITSQYHQNGSEAGNINIVFIDTNNQNKAKTAKYSETYPSASTGSGMSGVAEEGCEAGYVVHPAFNYGGTALPGFWVGKYETSSTQGNSDSTSGDNVTNKTIQIKAGVASWRYIQVSNIFTVCTNMNSSGNPYGLNTSDSVVDPHMMKNSEWGAVAYLSRHTTYGKGNEVWINNSSSYITGNAGNSVNAGSASGTTNAYDTGNGPQASTTGNVTGVYDMSGGAYEYVAAYVNNSYVVSGQNPYTYGSTLINAATKYKDVYSVGSSDMYDENYAVSTPENGKYGDAVYETSSSSSSPYMNSWYSDYSYFPCTSGPFFFRGGYYNDTSSVGVFYFNNYTGSSYSDHSFRVVLPVLL